MQVTHPRAWLLLAAFGGMAIMMLLWAVGSEITTTLEQSGVIVVHKTLVAVTAPEEGRVSGLPVETGGMVAEGQIVARIETETGTVEVTSPADGRLIAVRSRVGDWVGSGEALITLEGGGHEPDALTAIAFVPLDQRQRLRVGMPVQVLPATVSQEEYGYIKGRVEAVASFAATREEIVFLLDDPDRATHLLATGPVFEVRVTLERNADAQLVWSASNGPETGLINGSPCLLKIEIDRTRPIDRVFGLVS